MTNDQLWDAIINLAKWLHLSCSGLAKLAGLDATTFNKSKRINRFGEKRWPTTCSLAKVLNATGFTLAEFAEKFMPKDNR